MTSVTINDVAARAGVSIKTVSRVLNKEPHVRPTTLKCVLDAVDALNYRPNLAARALAGARSYLIALYFDNPSPDYIAALQLGAMQACREAGYHLLVEQIDGGTSRDGQFEALLRTVRVDGVVLSPPVCDRIELLDALDEQGIPYVRIAPSIELERSPYVYMDDRQAAYEMTRHLQDLGHRRIGFIKGHASHASAALRLEGFSQAMSDAGLEAPAALIQPGNFSFRSGAGGAERLLNLPDPPTAIFASNDDMALGVLAVANRMQMSMPEALSVAGFDDSPIAEVVWPQLTTIRQPVAAMAAEAVAMLIEPGARPKDGRLLQFKLVVRGSTASARGKRR